MTSVAAQVCQAPRCGADLSGRRPGVRYCGPACTVRASRWRARAAEHPADVGVVLDGLLLRLGHRPITQPADPAGWPMLMLPGSVEYHAPLHRWQAAGARRHVRVDLHPLDDQVRLVTAAAPLPDFLR